MGENANMKAIKIIMGILGAIFTFILMWSFGFFDDMFTTSNSNNKLQIIDHKWLNEGYNSYITGTVKNNSLKKYSYVQIEINLYDKSGAQVDSTLDNVNNLEPGGIWKFKAIVLEPKRVSKYRIKGVSGW